MTDILQSIAIIVMALTMLFMVKNVEWRFRK